MKLKAFKDLVRPGQSITLVRYTVNGADAVHKYMRIQRVVVHTQSNSFALAASTGALRDEWQWLDWPKASELVHVAPSVFALRFDDHGHITLVYRIGTAS